MTRLIRIALAMVILGFTFQLMADSQKVLEIAITASRQISANGGPTTLEALMPILRKLAKNKGEVW